MSAHRATREVRVRMWPVALAALVVSLLASAALTLLGDTSGRTPTPSPLPTVTVPK